MIRKSLNSPNVLFRNVRVIKIHSSSSVMKQSKKHSKEENECRTRFNPIKIQMLSSGLYHQIFGNDESYDISESIQKMVIEHLKKHKLWKNEVTTLPEVNLHLPRMYGSDISDHFEIIGTRQSNSYKILLEKLVHCNLPPVPEKWKFSSGWTRYHYDGNVESIEFPEDSALVFDVEVCVQEGNYPTIAAAASEKYWYLWCSERLVQDQFSWSQGTTLSDLIPLETSLGQMKCSVGKNWNPRLVIGHNVSFDRAFIKEQYLLQGTKMHFLDTMSLHICISGLTGIQRAMSVACKNASKTDDSEFSNSPLTWMDISSLNNLADVYSLYCEGASLKKEQRDIFVSGTLTDVREKFQDLATYCARDVQATHKVLQKVTPLFFERFPHPVTFAGMLEMSSAYLPVNQNWERYLRDVQDTYDDLEKELKLLLVHLANDACSLYHGSMYKNDPWLWDLDWSVQEIKFRKASQQEPSKKKRRKLKATNKDKLIIEDKGEVKESSAEEDIGSESLVDPILNDMFKSAASLTKVRRFLPGYPVWYRELNSKNKGDNIDWEPGPSLISTQMRSVPKLMRLTWDGFPLHFDNKHGWGYLVPGKSQSECIRHQNFPLEHLLELYMETDRQQINTLSSDVDFAWTLVNQPKESKLEEDKCWKLILTKANSEHAQKTLVTSDGSPYHYGNGPYDDVDVRGCWFYRLPHKDGPHKRVGNPLSKDFLAKVEDGTLKAWGKNQANRALLLSKTLSYWKNSHSRIVSQMVVWLNKSELPRSVTRSSTFDEDNLYGAILPRLVVAGTVTRRAVEPTWLTASNAYADRVGSELKSMIQCPPGYHFVGADVDSQELWIAALFGDSQFAGIHGCTAFGWMTLQGKKSTGTDMHSRTATMVGITRDQAKILNYGRIYGAGLPFSQRLLMQFNHRLTPEEAKCKIKKMYAETKGVRQRVCMNEDEDQEVIIWNTDSPELSRKIWVGGSESHMFNKLEEIAQSSEPRTPVLKCCISRALEPAAVDQNFMTSRVNWVVQSSAVDYLHLMLVCMKWLFDEFAIEGRFSISIHDEVRYLVKSEDRYRAALALQITNLLTRSFFAFKLGMKDLPQSVAFFSSVDIDSVLRKEVTMDCTTPSNPHGLEKGYGIPEGETLDIFQVIEKTNGGSLRKAFHRKS